MPKKEHKSMKGATLPKDRWEKNEGKMGHECKEKYASEMGNPGDLDRSTEGLAGYVRKNKMKY